MSADEYGMGLFPQHAALLAASGISPEVARDRGYVSVDTKSELKRRGFGVSQANVPALLVPLWDARGDRAGYQARPDEPRVNNGKPLKYETPIGKRTVLDVPKAVRPHLGSPSRPLLITEGVRKADAAVSAGLDCVALLGVWNWRGRNEDEGLVALADWEWIALNDRRVYVVFDSDVTLKREVHTAMGRLKALLERRGADVAVVYLPHGEAGAKCGLDDYLAAGHTTDDLLALAEPELRDPTRTPAPAPEPRPLAQRRTLGQVDEVFREWLADPDLGALRAALAAVVANRAPGDPVWLMLIAPPSAGKTETLMPLAALPDVTVAARMTVGALLSGTSTKEHAADATGGLLRQIGDAGILLCKDFGAVLAMPRDARAEVLQALRDTYDGRWDRHIGTDGGRVLTWVGHCGFIGGTTEAIDSHHSVIAALGDRFISVRLALPDPELQAVRAIGGGGSEQDMRDRLSETVAGLLDHVSPTLPDVGPLAKESTARLAVLTVRCRSVVERDTYSTREIINVPSPEQPARVAKQLAKLLAGLVAIGCSDADAWTILIRVALDSIPAGRRQVLDYLHTQSSQISTGAVGNAVGLPTSSVKRHLEDLEAHGVVERHRMGEGKADVWAMSEWTQDRWPGSPTTQPEMSEGLGARSVITPHPGGSSNDPESTHDYFSGEVVDRDRAAL